MNNYEKLCNVLKTNPALVTENGDLLKNKVQELARKMDASLLATLLSDTFTEEMFFVDVNGMKVFDANKFTYMVESQAFLPDSYTRFKQNIMLTDGSHSIRKSGDVVLEFPNKDCVLEFDSTDTDTARDEVFLNETLMKKEIDTLLDHKAFCNAKRYTSDGVAPAIDVAMDDNLIIKGNNLLALHTLYPKYKGQIKLMYWDILYNTDNDQVPYNDSFKHSSWLTMMKNRLEIALKLLKDGGVMCIQCDDNEQAYMTVLCDEIFGRDNRVNTICVKMSESSGVKMSHVDKKLPKIKEYLLVYKKGEVVLHPIKYSKTDNIEYFKKYAKYYSQIITNPDDEVENWKIVSIKDYIKEHTSIDSRDEDAVLKFKLANAKRVVYRTNNASLSKMNFLTKTKKVVSTTGIEYIWWEGKQMLFLSDYTEEYLCDMWTDISTINLNKEGSVALKNGKKPEYLINRILSLFTDEGDIVLDAYLGSGTTAAVAHKMGRRYIGIEQLASHSAMEIERMQSVIAGEQTGISKAVNWTGGGSFVFFELAKNSQIILDRITATNDTDELSAIYDELKSSPFVLYTVDILKMEKEKDAFAALAIDDQKKFLISIVDKNTLYINYSDIENDNHSLSDADKAFTKNFYKED